MTGLVRPAQPTRPVPTCTPHLFRTEESQP